MGRWSPYRSKHPQIMNISHCIIAEAFADSAGQLIGRGFMLRRQFSNTERDSVDLRAVLEAL